MIWTRILLLASVLPSASGLTLLGRQSTAEQVYSYLNQNNQLAPYVKEGGTAIVTGGNSGIGAETVKVLAKAGMHVVLCARNMESASALIESLPEAHKDRVQVQQLDLSSLGSVKEAADSIGSKYETIDCLVNNAGIMALKERETSVDGIEMQFATNHVGHHLLTRLLLPKMESNGRIVNVASTAHTMAREPLEDWESKDSYSPWGAYGQSKLSNILFTKQLQKELENDVDAVCLHPGVIASPLWKHTLPKLLQRAVSLIANKSIEQGAATSVYCALSRFVEGGAYYDDCAVTVPATTAESKKLKEGLWKYTEELLATKGFELPQMSTESAELSVTK